MKTETKVGIMFILAFLGALVFAYFLGFISPFGNSHEITVVYQFAGGIEVGSPVRVMGIKVGKVKDISFDPAPSGESQEVTIKIKVSVNKKAWDTIREDSKYYINLAGIIGEKFLEITPGSANSPLLKPDSVVRGEDPPRIDQLISQSYGLAGKIIEMIEKNEGSVVETIETLNKLVVNLNGLMGHVNRLAKNKDTTEFTKNIVSLTGDLAFLVHKLKEKDGQETLSLINELIHRLKGLDAKAIKTFFQEEGIRAKIF